MILRTSVDALQVLQQILHGKLFLAKKVNRQYDSQYMADGAKMGADIKIRLPNKYVIRSGKNLSWPLDHDMGPDEDIPEPIKRWFKLQKRLEWKTRVHDLHTYEVRVQDDAIEVDV
jgi:hypothetical protein